MTRRPLTHGWCLLCRQAALAFWIGPVEHAGLAAPAFICEPCADFIREYIAFYNQQRDARPAC